MSPDRHARGVVAVVVAVAAGLLCACGGDSKPAAPATVTVTGSAANSSRTSTPTAGSGAGTAASTSTATPLPTSTTTLGGLCEAVLPISVVDQAVGAPVVGKTSFIVNQPDSKAGQVERINCRYGIVPVKAGSKVTDTKVEVSVTLYATNAQAAQRVAGTADEWRGGGAVPHSVQVGGHPATVLIGYGKPLLVVAAGPRTVAVTMTASVVTAAKLDAVIAGVAAAALRGAGG